MTIVRHESTNIFSWILTQLILWPDTVLHCKYLWNTFCQYSQKNIFLVRISLTTDDSRKFLPGFQLSWCSDLTLFSIASIHIFSFANILIFSNLESFFLESGSADVVTWQCSLWQVFMKYFLPIFSIIPTCKVFPGFWLSWCRDLTMFYGDGGAIDSVNSNQTTTSQPFMLQNYFSHVYRQRGKRSLEVIDTWKCWLIFNSTLSMCSVWSMIYHLAPQGGDLCDLLPLSATCYTVGQGSISYAFTLSDVCLTSF